MSSENWTESIPGYFSNLTVHQYLSDFMNKFRKNVQQKKAKMMRLIFFFLSMTRPKDAQEKVQNNMKLLVRG
jgi:hypothetical protein